ncbi:conjugal transfer protein, partial [Klebsiella pneumoniae]|nr:conjugal transfer protein [Klebsiella pneumoniae]
MKEQSPILIVLFLFLRKGREDMTKIRSYTSIWSVEKVIYA